MQGTVQGLLVEAKAEIDAGDRHYAVAAQKITAAMAEQPELTWASVGREVGKDGTWVRRLVTSFKDYSPESGEDFKVDWERGTHTAEIREGVRSKPELVAEALEDPEVAQAVAAAASPQALANVDVAASTETYMRKRKATKAPPEDAASHQLGGVGPGATSDRLHGETMEPMIDKVHAALMSARNRWLKHGFRLALTKAEGLSELDAEVTEIGRLYAEMLDLYDAAKATKLANEAEGARA